MSVQTPHLLYRQLNQDNVHESIKAVVRYLARKVDGREVDSSRLLKYFDSYAHYKLFTNAISMSYLRSICYSEHYVVLNRVSYSKYFSEGRVTNSYVVGVNIETNKLFTLREFPRHVTGHYITEINGIPFFRCSDADVRSSLFFVDVDLDLDPHDEVMEKLAKGNFLRVRVQGDVVAMIEKTSFDEYVRQLRLRISEVVAFDIADNIRNKIIDILAGLSLSAEALRDTIQRNSNVQTASAFIPIPPQKDWSTFKSKMFVPLARIASAIEAKLDVSDVSEYLNVDKISVRQRETFRDSERYIDGFAGDKPIFGIIIGLVDNGIRIDVLVSHHSIIDTPRIESIVNEVLKDIEWRETTIRFGRHRITIEKALPTVVTVKIETTTGSRVVTFEFPLIAMGTVTFTHPEHKEKTLYIAQPVELNFTSLVDVETAERLNLYTLKKWLKP